MLDNLKRIFFLKNEIKRIFLKSNLRNRKVNYSRRYLSYYYLINLPRFSSRTLVRNRCIMTGRVWSINKKTKLSRFVFRSKANKTNLPGYSRASW